MKKVLFVLGLAMCTTLSMAQTSKAVGKIGGPAKVLPSKALEAPVDYKASIFTKDDDEVIATFDFASENMTGIGYGSNYVVKDKDVINFDGKDSTFSSTTCHGRSESFYYWTRVKSTSVITDTASADSKEFFSTYPNSIQYGAINIPPYMGSQNGINDDNGFMFMGLIETFNNTGKGNINAYFELPVIDLPEGTELIDVDWRQYHRKFYESCYVDYQKGSKWYAVEVNVPNIDVNVNGTSPAHYVLTLPPAAADQESLKIRFRVSASDASQVYGYFWAIDNVNVVIPANTTRWDFIQPGYMDGFYGTIPQGFNIPLGYVVYSRNRGIDDLTGITLDVNHVQTGDNVLSASQSNLPAGNPQKVYLMTINERGYMITDRGLDNTSGFYQSLPQYWENADNYGADAADMPSKYKLRGLPTSTSGLNQFALIANNNEGLSTSLDTMAYYVSPFQDADPTMGRTIEGYRWGYDNSVVPSGSEFAFQFTEDGYVTDDPSVAHHYEPDYEVFTSFNSPSEIPIDEKGKPYVFRGLEYVTATTLTSEQIDGSKITPVLWYSMPIEEDQIGLYDVPGTGIAGDQVFTIDGYTSASEEVEYGVAQPGSPYYAYDITFPGQPEIWPNVNYFIGYINQGGHFAVAGTQYYYMETADSSVRYSNNSAIAPYYNQYSPLYRVYSVLAYDPIYGRSVSGWNIDRFPMIRAIVGPRMDIPQYTVTLQCTDDTSYWMTTGSTQNMCGYIDTVGENSSMSYYIIPGTIEEFDEESNVFGHMVIDQILVNGEPIDLDDENMVTATEYNVIDPEHAEGTSDPWPPLLERNYYRLTLREIDQNYTISAVASYHELGINEAEALVRVALSPNPATSQVRLNVSGMTGMVNCSIIDMSGREIYNSNFNAGSEQTIDLNGVPAGAYFVRVTNDNFSKVEKLIVR